MISKSQLAAAVCVIASCYQSAAAGGFPRAEFDRDSAAITVAADANLHMAADLFKANPDWKTDLVAGACEIERDSDSLWFERASAVRTFMLQHGVPARQIRSVLRERRIPGESAQECTGHSRMVVFAIAAER